MNINEIKEIEKRSKYASVEVYEQLELDNGYYSWNFHGDYIRELEDYTGLEEVERWAIMDEDEYNNSILVNCCVSFSDIFEKNDKILVILLKK